MAEQGKDMKSQAQFEGERNTWVRTQVVLATEIVYQMFRFSLKVKKKQFPKMHFRLT